MEFAWDGWLPWSPLWSRGQSSWPQIRSPGFVSPHYQKKISWSGTRSTQPREYNWGATWQKSSGSCPQNREYGRRDPSRWPRDNLYPQKLAIISPTSGGRSVSIVRSRTQTWIFFMFGCPIQLHRNKPFIVFSHTPLCFPDSFCYRIYIVTWWPRPAIISQPRTPIER
jgi:hypothetical protein